MVTGYWIRIYEKVETQINIIGLDGFINSYCGLLNKEKKFTSLDHFLSMYPEHGSNIKKLLKLFHSHKDDIIVIELNNDLISSTFNINSILGACVDKKSDEVFLTVYNCSISYEDIKNIVTLKL